MNAAELLLVRLTLTSGCTVAVAALAAYGLRNWSASTRALVWQCVGPVILICSLAGILPCGVHLGIFSRDNRSGDVVHRNPAFCAGSEIANTAKATDVSLKTLSKQTVSTLRRDAIGESTSPLRTPSQTRPEWRESALPTDLFSRISVVRSGVITTWIVGILFFAVRFAQAVWRVDKVVRNARRVELGGERHEVIARAHFTKTLQSGDVDTPWVAGLFRPALVVPKGFFEWPFPDQRMAVEHECGHVVRHDLLWQNAFALVCCLAWFQPLVWYARHRYRLERELACDDRVVRGGFEREDVARFLVGLLRQTTSGKSSSLGISVASPPIRNRVLSILDPSTKHQDVSTGVCRVVATACVLASLVAGLVRWSPANTVLAQDAVPSAESKTDVTIPVKTSSINLTVTDQTDLAVAEVQVFLFTWNGKEYRALGESRATDEQGTALISDLPVDEMVYVFLAKPGYAVASTRLVFAKASNRHVTLKMSAPATAQLELRDPRGKPVEGAKLESVNFTDVHGGQGFIHAQTPAMLGLTLGASDVKGRLQLPELPRSSTADLKIVHPDWAPLWLPGVEIADGLISSLTMTTGTKFQIRIANLDGAPLPDGIPVSVLLQGETRGGHVNREVVSVNGGVQLTVDPNNYEVLTVRAKSHFIGPTLFNFPGSSNANLDLRGDREAAVELVSWKKRRVRGRVVDQNGRGVAGVRVSAVSGTVELKEELRDVLRGENRKQLDVMNQARSVDVTVTRKNGDFTVWVADGLALIAADKDEFAAEIPFAALPVNGKPTDLDDPIVLNSTTKITGQVLDSDGEPVARAVVWVEDRVMNQRELTQTNELGEFELALPPLLRSHGSPTFGGDVIAMNPRTGDAAMKSFEIGQEGSLQFKLEPRSDEWMLAPNGDDWRSRATAERLQEWRTQTEDSRKRYPDGVEGSSVPDMEFGTWLNSSATSLTDYRGRFVLLDFWFIGCGPCIEDMPELKLIHESFPKDKFAIVGVHTNSQTRENVEAFLNESGIKYCVVVDDPSGIISDSFSPLGVHSYPTYILLDPNGRIVHNDALRSEYWLRMQKLQLIRNAIHGWDWSQESSDE